MMFNKEQYLEGKELPTYEEALEMQSEAGADMVRLVSRKDFSAWDFVAGVDEAPFFIIHEDRIRGQQANLIIYDDYQVLSKGDTINE